MTPKEVQQTFVVHIKSHFQILFVTDHGYFITSNGGFGQRDLYIEAISQEEGQKILAMKTPNPAT